MSRTAHSTKIALAALTLVAVTASSSLACGGGGGGRSSSRFGISYNRNIGHMATQAPRHGYTTSGGNYHHHKAPSYHSAPVVHQPVHVQPQYAQPQYVQQPLPQQVVQQPIVQQPVVQQQVIQQDASLPQFAPQQVAQPIDTVATPASIDPAAQSAEDAALAALAAFGE